MNEKRSIESCMFQVLKEEEINLARKEGVITELEKNIGFLESCIKDLKIYCSLKSIDLKEINLTIEQIRLLRDIKKNYFEKRLKELLGGETK